MGSCGGVRLISAQSLLSSSITEGGANWAKTGKYISFLCVFSSGYPNVMCVLLWEL